MRPQVLTELRDLTKVGPCDATGGRESERTRSAGAPSFEVRAELGARGDLQQRGRRGAGPRDRRNHGMIAIAEGGWNHHVDLIQTWSHQASPENFRRNSSDGNCDGI